MSLIKYLIYKILFGRFSYNFQSLIAKSTTSFGNHNYLQPCSKLDPRNHYSITLKHDANTSEFFTEKKIEFQNHPFNLTFRQVRRRNKRFSCYDVFKYQDYYWKRLGFRERIFNTGVRLIYHFVAGRFFFGEMFFSDASKLNTEIVAMSLLKKYTDQRTVPPKNFKISGKDSFIFFEHNGINLSIKYIFTGNEELNVALNTISSFSPFTKIEYSNEMEELL